MADTAQGTATINLKTEMLIKNIPVITNLPLQKSSMDMVKFSITDI